MIRCHIVCSSFVRVANHDGTKKILSRGYLTSVHGIDNEDNEKCPRSKIFLLYDECLFYQTNEDSRRLHYICTNPHCLVEGYIRKSDPGIFEEVDPEYEHTHWL